MVRGGSHIDHADALRAGSTAGSPTTSFVGPSSFGELRSGDQELTVARTGDIRSGATMFGMDEDLDRMSETELRQAARLMRAAIRKHRDSAGHELCWHHPDMWDLLPDRSATNPAVPEWPQFMRGCIAYRSSLDTQLAAAPRFTDEYDQDGAGWG